jgi:predicted RNase H-like HicB family nuclease
MRYWIRIYSHGHDVSAMVPDLPGCVAAGDSVEQVQELIAEAVMLHLDDMRKSGQKVPAPTTRMDIDVADLEDGEMYGWVNVRVPKAKAHRKHRMAG